MTLDLEQPVIRFRWPDDPATLDEVMTAVAALRQEVERLRQQLPEHLVDIDEAAERLGVGVRTVRRWVAEERIPYRRIGRTLRFPLAALNPLHQTDRL